MVKLRLLPKLVLSFALLLAIYNEFVAYSILPLTWSFAGHKECKGTCTKILLVADPQILGEQDSNFVARWDCDRYLEKTFTKALSHVQPDVVIFLGDVMDEGHIAGNEQYQLNLARFQSMFATGSIPTVCIPGDNDIGGEGDPILPHIVHRFDSSFDQSQDFSLGDIEFYRINKMTLMFQEPDAFNAQAVRVGLTHMPILRKIHTFSKRIATSLKPHIIFSGHDHVSEHISAPLDNVWDKKVDVIKAEDTDWLDYSIQSDVIHEIIVPTCSYRMGVLHMGYGYAVIDEATKTLSFRVLWLPRRLLHLFTYLGLLIVFLLCLLFVIGGNLLRLLQRLVRSCICRRTTRYFHLA